MKLDRFDTDEHIGCEPQIVFRSANFDGESWEDDSIYNCHECEEQDCEYWKQFNHITLI